MEQTLLHLDNISVAYGSKIIFRNLDLTIRRGAHWALVGPAGSGKTALLEVMGGRLASRGGALHYPFFEPYRKAQEIIDPLSSPQRLVAFVGSRHSFRNTSNTTEFYYQQRYQSTESGLAPTVQEYLQALAPVEPAHWNYEEVVGQLHLQQLLDEELIKLSTGETRRVMMAAALLRNPVLLLLDNPLAGLDAASRKSFNSFFSRIAASGITLVMTAVPTELPDVINHVAVLDNGKMTTWKREDFVHETFVQPKEKPLDVRELGELLSVDPPPEASVVIRMQDVTVRYGARTILQDINWTVLQGERWALLGGNGAGKSTLLSLVSGDNPQAFAKNIILFDRRKGSGESIWELKRKTGFMSSELFQYFPSGDTLLHVVESGFYETVGLFRPSDPALAALSGRWLRLLGVREDGDALFSGVPLSTQRLCLLARALVKNPSLLLLDEPCAGLDASQQAHFRRLVDTICRQTNKTLVYVSHYEEEIPESVTHRLVLQNGRIAEIR